MPRRCVAIETSPTAPAFTGNPDLQPERAWRLDASWLRRRRSPLKAHDSVGGESVRVVEGGVPVSYRSTEAWRRGTLIRLGFETPI